MEKSNIEHIEHKFDINELLIVAPEGWVEPKGNWNWCGTCGTENEDVSNSSGDSLGNSSGTSDINEKSAVPHECNHIPTFTSREV